MKKLFLIITFIILSCNSYGAQFGLNLGGQIFSKSLNGTLTGTDTEGKLVSNGNFHYGIKTGFSMTNSIALLIEYNSREVDFDNSNNIISGEEVFKVDSTSVGLRFILMPRVAIRTMYTMEKDLGFELDGNNKAVIYTEDIGYLTIYYDQIVFLSAGMYSGFKLGYDLPASGANNLDRTGTRINLFANIHNFETSYELRSFTKNNSTLDFVEKDAVLTISYRLTF